MYSHTMGMEGMPLPVCIVQHAIRNTWSAEQRRHSLQQHVISEVCTHHVMIEDDLIILPSHVMVQIICSLQRADESDLVDLLIYPHDVLIKQDGSSDTADHHLMVSCRVGVMYTLCTESTHTSTCSMVLMILLITACSDHGIIYAYHVLSSMIQQIY